MKIGLQQWTPLRFRLVSLSSRQRKPRELTNAMSPPLGGAASRLQSALRDVTNRIIQVPWSRPPPAELNSSVLSLRLGLLIAVSSQLSALSSQLAV